MRVVIDTNVLISALLSAIGAPAQILRLALEGKVELIFSPETVKEHWRVLHYARIQERLSRLGISMKTAEQAVRRLAETSHVVPGKEYVDAVADDPSDNMFLACAVEGRADYIVSGDSHLKQLKHFQGIPILEPTHFVDVFFKS